MSDLISRSALIEKLEEKMFDSKLMCPVIKLTNLIELIDEQPTAYDVDKVVEGLEKEESVKLYGSINSGNYMIPLKDAIEIVRKGGVE